MLAKDQWLQQEAGSIPQKLNTAETYLDLDAVRGRTPKRTIAFIKSVPGDPTTDDNIVGFAVVIAKDVSGLRVGVVEQLMVNPTYQRNNIGSLLMDVCLTYMFQAQFDLSVAKIAVGNEAALHLLSKVGYLKCEVENLRIRPLRGYTACNFTELAAKI